MLRMLCLLPVLCLLVTLAAAADGPAWLPDAPNSRWITFGGPTGLTESNGITLRDKTGEGDLTPAERGGISCARSVINDGRPGYYYLEAEPWDRLKTWLGDADVLLTVRYFDGAPGTLVLKYDSSDPRVKFDPYPAGVWRTPDDYPKGVELKGTKTWLTLTTRLQLPYFTKRVHGGDIRLEGHSPDIALAGVAITRVPKGADPQLQISQELRVARATGMQALGKVARFAGTFKQDGDKPLVLEAELATSVSLANGRTPGTDPAASGGGYLHYVDNATWKITVATPGRYIAWERGSYPWAGGWNHEESLENGAQSNVVVDSTGPPKAGWQWVKAGSYDLTAGEHTFRASYCGGAKLDVIVLSRDTTPPELATLRSSYQGATVGELWTSPVTPFDVAQWRSVTFTVVGGGTVGYEYSHDGGKTWTTFDPARGLVDVPVRGGGADSLIFHLTLKGDGAPAFFAGGALVYQAGPKNVKTVENARLRLEIDPYGVKSLFDKHTNAYVSKAAQFHDPLATIVVKKPGPATVSSLDLYNGTLEKIEIGGTVETPVLTLAHRLANGMGLTTTAKLLPNGQSEWQLAIENPTEQEVAEIRFPVITGCALQGNPADDWIFMPKYWGQVWQHPAGDHMTTMWGPCMRWMMLWDNAQGLYLDIEDPRFDDYAFTYGGDSSGGMTIAATQRIRVAPRATWTSGVYRLAVTGGDWHQGADIYRGYVAKALQPCDVHPLVKWLTDGWITQASNDISLVGWDVITPTAEPFMAANRQMTDGADSGYCGLYPYPAAAWGSTREFAQKLAVRRAFGGIYTPYHNFHLWSPGYGHDARVGTYPKALLPKGTPTPDDAWYATASAKYYDGSYTRMENDHFAQLDMAMGSREWRNWLAYWTNAYLDWGTDGMYYDQFNMIYGNGALYPDFPTTYGCWMPATLSLITTMKRNARAKNPVYSSSGEFANDVYGQYVDMHMTSGVVNRLEFFRYCLPAQILIDGGWNGGTAGVYGGQDRYRFIWQVGARFEGFPNDTRITALRRAVKSLLYDAQFMDTVGVTVRDGGQVLVPEYTYANSAQNAPFRGTIARWFLYTKDGARGAVVNIINAPVKPGATVSLDTSAFGPVVAAYAWTLEGQCLPVRGVQQGNRFTFPVPASELSSVILTRALPPVVQWSLDAAAAPGVTRTLAVTLTNPNAVALSGTTTLRLPAGWSASPAAFGPLAPGASLTFSLPVSVPATAKAGRYNITCAIDTPQGSFATYNLLAVNRPVVTDFRGDPGSYHLWLKNLTATTIRGTAAVSAPAPLTAIVPTAFTLPPNGALSLPVTVTGQTKLAKIAEMRAVVTMNGQATTLLRAVIPAVPNGDFEQDAAGDRKPDWWFVRKVGDEWAYERMHLAEGAHAGKSCLLLDPPKPGEQFIGAYPVHSVLAPNTHYRVSVWIKAESPTGVYANVMGLILGSGKTNGTWQQFTGEFRTGAGRAALGRVCFNFSDKPAYFDDLVVEEITE